MVQKKKSRWIKVPTFECILMKWTKCLNSKNDKKKNSRLKWWKSAHKLSFRSKQTLYLFFGCGRKKEKKRALAVIPLGEMFLNCWYCVIWFCCRFANNFDWLLQFSVWSIAIILTVQCLFLSCVFFLCVYVHLNITLQTKAIAANKNDFLSCFETLSSRRIKKKKLYRHHNESFQFPTIFFLFFL